MKVAIYPGSFDPITNGHLDVLLRAANVFDKVIVLVADNSSKSSRFSSIDRVEMIKEATKDIKNVEVDYSNGLTVDYAKKHNATHLIRGLRAVTDYEYELQLVAANSFVDPNIDTVFFMSRGLTSNISSSMIMQLFNSGVDISNLVPISVINKLKNK